MSLSTDVLLLLVPTPPPTAWMSALEAKYPGFSVRYESTQNPDLSVRPLSEIPDSSWDGVTMLMSYIPPPADKLPKMRFVQLLSAGSDMWKSNQLYLNKDIVFCNASGVQPAQIAEWVIGSLLSAQHKFPRYQAFMKEGYWEHNFNIDVDDCYGSRIGILGYGAIGRQVARLSKALGMEVYAFTHRERPTPESRCDSTWSQPGQGDPTGEYPSKWFHGPDKAAVNEFLAQDLDVLVVSLPLTDTTYKLLGHEQFEILGRRNAFVVNIARGAVIDQDALYDALENNVIRGAAVDVTDPEPLPSDHKLWKAKNLLITPHVSWKSKKYWGRIMQLAEANLEALATGGKLFNEVKR